MIIISQSVRIKKAVNRKNLQLFYVFILFFSRYPAASLSSFVPVLYSIYRMEEKIRQASEYIGGLITSPSSRKEKMEANSASMDRIRDALLAVVNFCAKVCSR